MRGPALNTKTEEVDETVVSEVPEMKLDNESDNRHSLRNRSVSNGSSKKEDDDNNKPIWKVGRILIDSLSKGKMRRSKIFGAPLEDLPLNCQGIPKIVQRLCSYLEQFGLKEPNLFASLKKQGKLVERFKISFDRAGDADLENCSDVKVIASLLKLWLHDLPYPLIPLRVSNRLKVSFQKYDRKEIYDLNVEICNVLITCPALNLGILYTVVRLLYYYVTKWYNESYVDQLPEMFAKILIGDIEVEHVEIIAALIRNFHIIFNEKILERAFKLYVIPDKKSRANGQKVPEVTFGVKCGKSALSVEKLSRSNSEEKLSLRNDHNQNLWTRNLNMRRVNSHEDFSGSHDDYCRSLQNHLVNSNAQNSPVGNLCEFEDDNVYDDEQYDDEPVIDNFQKITFASDKDSEVVIAPPPFKYSDDDRVQEEIRNEERLTPQFNTHRTMGRKKRTTHQGHNGRPKVHDIFEEDTRYSVPKLGEFFDRDVYTYVTCPDESIVFPNWNTTQDCDAQSTSSTSSSSSSGNNSPDRHTSSPEPAEYSRDHSEPFNNYRNWSYTHRHPFSVKSTNLTEPVGDDEATSACTVHLSNVNSKILQMNKHLQWAKKRLRRFENEFKDKSGDTLTGLNKMTHPEYKQLTRTVIFLRNNLKHLRVEANENFTAQRFNEGKYSNNYCNLSVFSRTTDKQIAVEKAQKHLYEKRVAGERPESVENMTHQQLLDEKISIQEVLLCLENIFGQTAARNEESFRSLYEHCRMVKRYLARSSISVKLKEAVSDLPTIVENETMEFDAGSTSFGHNNDGRTTPSTCQSVCNVAKSDFHTGNLRELSSPELMMEYKITKEERKKLRNRIYMFEQEAENQWMDDNNNHCIHSLRRRYKNTKAKLKLLEALVVKTTK